MTTSAPCSLVEGAIKELKRKQDVEVTVRPFELHPFGLHRQMLLTRQRPQ